MKSTSSRSPRTDDPAPIRCRICNQYFSAINHFHLVHKHDFAPENPIQRYMEMFPGAPTRSDRMKRRVKRARREHLERTGRRWAKERVVKEIRREHKAGRPVNSHAVQDRWPALSVAAHRLFGTWEKALAAAGLDPVKERVTAKWTKRSVLRALKALPEGITYQRMRREHPALLDAAVRHFGGWRKASAEAGIRGAKPSSPRRKPGERRKRRPAASQRATASPKPAKTRKRPNPREEREQILARIRKIGPLRHCELVRKGQEGLYAAARRAFGSWKKAVESAGLALPPRPGHNKMWTRKSVIAEIHRLDCPLRFSDVVAAGHNRVYVAAQKVFGTWGKAVRAAGLETAPPAHSRHRKWTREKILAEIRRIGPRRHCELSRMGMEDPYNGARTVFGTWEAAVAAAGVGKTKKQ